MRGVKGDYVPSLHRDALTGSQRVSVPPRSIGGFPAPSGPAKPVHSPRPWEVPEEGLRASRRAVSWLVTYASLFSRYVVRVHVVGEIFFAFRLAATAGNAAVVFGGWIGDGRWAGIVLLVETSDKIADFWQLIDVDFAPLDQVKDDLAELGKGLGATAVREGIAEPRFPFTSTALENIADYTRLGQSGFQQRTEGVAQLLSWQSTQTAAAHVSHTASLRHLPGRWALLDAHVCLKTPIQTAISHLSPKVGPERRRSLTSAHVHNPRSNPGPEAPAVRRWGIRLGLALVVAIALGYLPSEVLRRDPRAVKIEQQLRRLDQEARDLAAANAALTREVEALRSDVGAIEEHARSDLGMVYPDEVVFRIRAEGSR